MIILSLNFKLCKFDDILNKQTHLLVLIIELFTIVIKLFFHF